jgi:aspartate beta-hydroxylase
VLDAYTRGDRDFCAARAAHWPGARGDGPLLAQFLNYAGAGPDPGHLFEAHKFGYDFDTLRTMLELAGFSEVSRSGYMQSADPALQVDAQSAVAGAGHAGSHYSLFVEARVAGAAPSASPEPTGTGPAEHVRAARSAMAAGRPQQAAQHLQEARARSPQDAHLARSHGVALMAAGDLDAAEQALREALALDPALPAAHLHLGRLLERRGQLRAAVSAYFRAITQAQARELWLDEASTPAWLRADVLHAMQQVREQRVPMLMSLLQPLQERFGASALLRVRSALAHYLGVESHPPSDPRQAPRFLHVPGLSPRPWLDGAHADWRPRLESQFAAAREEALSLFESRQGLQPFLDSAPDTDLSPYLGGHDARWDALFFYRHGTAVAAGRERAPRTASALEKLPLVRIPGHAPEICFSVLAPGTHIKPHHGVTNARVVVHLGLVIPPGCRLTVGGEAREWREGESWVFDDTFLHEAINPSDAPRAILLMDAWHPDLDEAERGALSVLIEGIGEFHRG